MVVCLGIPESEIEGYLSFRLERLVVRRLRLRIANFSLLKQSSTHPGGLLCVLLDKQRKLYYRKTHQHITHVNGEAIGSTRGICRIMNF
jgi:hypothetical protein